MKKVSGAAANTTTADNAVSNTDTAPKVVICEVCGHGNPTNVGLCQMCSSYLNLYLYDVKKKEKTNDGNK